MRKTILISILFLLTFPLFVIAQDDTLQPNIKNTINYKDYEEVCGKIWCIKSIIIKEDGVLIEFDTNSGGFQVVYRIQRDGSNIPLQRGKNFFLKVGEKIGWGDGDHAFASIALDSIKDSMAFITIGNEHRPPATHQHLAYSKFRKCKFYGKYP